MQELRRSSTFYEAFRYRLPYSLPVPTKRYMLGISPGFESGMPTTSLGCRRVFAAVIIPNTVKPRFTGPLGGKELGPVNRKARYIGVHFTLIYT